MNINYLLYVLYLLTLLLCMVFGTAAWRRMEKAMRMFFVLVIAVTATELLALACEMIWGSNTAFYNIADILQSMLVFGYFGMSLKNGWLGIGLVCLTLLLGIFNYAFVQRAATINNYFLLWNGAMVMVLCIYQMVLLAQRQGNIKLHRYAHFLVAATLLFYWSINLLGFQLFNLFMVDHLDYAIMLNAFHLFSNVLTHTSFAAIFLYLAKLIQ